MTFEEFSALPEAEQWTVAQGLWAPSEKPLFSAIRRSFLEMYPACAAVATIHCGMASMMGHMNAITVRKLKGTALLRLPARFMGLVVLREYADA